MSERFQAGRAECLIFTFKEGVLSAVGHDLKIRVDAFTIEVADESSVKATFDASSLKVACARRGNVDDTGAISEHDKAQIEANIRDDVLEARKFPQIRFTSSAVERTGGGWSVRGDLTLHGVTRSITVAVRDEDGKRVGEAVLQQPDFGIKPFRAMLGALRVQPEVRVRIAIPASASP